MENAQKAFKKRDLTLTINVKVYKLPDVRANETLADVLRERLNLIGTKVACDEGACGSCTVLLDGKAMLSCMILAVTAEGKRITTIEGLKHGHDLHPIQEAFIEKRGYGCGYCTPGIIMSTKALLNKYPEPSEEMIKEGLAGNICRCAIYEHIVDAAKAAAVKVKEKEGR